MTTTKEPTAAEVIQMLLNACKELLAESGRQRAGDWEIINDGMVAGERFIRRSQADQVPAENPKCEHKWAHIEDHHVICEKCKHTADLCWTCEAEKVSVGGRLVCPKCCAACGGSGLVYIPALQGRMPCNQCSALKPKGEVPAGAEKICPLCYHPAEGDKIHPECQRRWDAAFPYKRSCCMPHTPGMSCACGCHSQKPKEGRTDS